MFNRWGNSLRYNKFMAEKISLKEHLEAIIEQNDKRYEQRFNDTKIAVDAALIAADKAVAAALAGQKEAVTKAEVAAEKRFESVNEFRNTLSDQQRNLMPRSEAEIQFKSLNEKVDALRLSDGNQTGQETGVKQGWGWAVGAGAGGNGGPIMIVFAKKHTITGSVSTNGNIGSQTENGDRHGAGGGGAGGTQSQGGDGGAGANGRIRLKACTITGTTNPTASKEEGGHSFCAALGAIL